MKRGLPSVVWILLGLLGLAAAMLSLGQRDLVVNPSIESYGPSGTSALAQLLRNQGYRVDLDLRPKPRLGPKDLAIAFTEINSYDRNSREELKPTNEALRKHAKEGGRVLVVEVPYQYQDVSRRLLQVEPVEVEDLGRKRTFRIHADFQPAADAPLSPAGNRDPSVRTWTSGDEDFVRASRVGRGTILNVLGGVGFTNRFLDRADNAIVATRLVDLLADKEGGRIVFTEAAFGNANSPGLLEILGPWAVASWYQLVFLTAVVLFTFGRRFGLPEVEPRRQQGARELLDAISDTYLRGRHSQVALRTTLARVEADVKSALRLPRDVNLTARDERLSPELRNAMAEAYAALTMDRLHSADALGIVRRLLHAKSEFVNQRRSLR
ncbi:MAG: DUF4350 domain-containing protein [Fimbriimonas sp.]